MAPTEDDQDRSGIGDLTQRIKSAAGLLKAPTTPRTAVTDVITEIPVTRKHLPLRYQVKEDTAGGYLTCVEASNIRVRIERGMSVSASAARKYATGTMFLDGAAQGEPFMDGSKGVYNLDHHQGCVRSFTLATCEQAMVVILKGLDLSGEQWTVYANDPDFDTVLAIWLLVNHRRIAADESLRRRIMPMVRLQGAIDAHGFELAELTGYSAELQTETLRTINELRAEELELKKEGGWGETDFLVFTSNSLQEIDALVYSPSDFEDLKDVEELAREWIAPQRLALACRSDSGIYEVEEHLRELHGERLGLVILTKDETTYTVRQSDPFLATNLEDAYLRLNLLDPAAGGDNAWGGSNEIGGSPRATGTALSLDSILAICRWVYNPPSAGRRLISVILAVAAAVSGVFLAMAASGFVGWRAFAWMPPRGFITGSGTLLALSLALALLGRSRFPGYFGVRWPRGATFLYALPATILAALAGGAWAPLHLVMGADPILDLGWTLLAAAAMGTVGIELLFRGVVHGLMVTTHPIMLWSGRRFISVPTAVSGLLYAVAVGSCFLPPLWLGDGAWVFGVGVAAAAVMGLTLGIVRERSASVWAAALIHMTSVAAAFGALQLVFG
jgi:membrane protease YdiL (CAAX protease family)